MESWKREHKREVSSFIYFNIPTPDRGPGHCPLPLPLHYWSTAAAEDGDLSVSRSLAGHPSPRPVAVVRWQRDAPGWMEGHSLPTMDHLALPNEIITDPLLQRKIAVV